MSEIERLREALGMRQEDLARLAKTSQPQINRLERGERKLTKEWAERLAPHLGVTAARLMFPEIGKIDYRKLRLLPPDISDLLEDQFEKRIDSEIELDKRRGRDH